MRGAVEHAADHGAGDLVDVEAQPCLARGYGEDAGGQFRPDQWASLYALGIRAVLSLQAEHEDTFVGSPPERALRLLVPDFHPPTIDQLHAAVDFIAAAHADQLPVFIHCHAGIGRAPLTTAAFLTTRGLSVTTALTAIRTARPIIALNQRQIARLHEWEQVGRRGLPNEY